MAVPRTVYPRTEPDTRLLPGRYVGFLMMYGNVEVLRISGINPGSELPDAHA